MPPLPDSEETLPRGGSWELICSQSWHSASTGRHRNFNDFDNCASSLLDHGHSDRRGVFHPHSEGTDLPVSNRYLRGRPPLREDGNPKGKHPRKPLPWRLDKLRKIKGCQGDADEYRELVWRKQREQLRENRELARGKTPDNTDPAVFSGRPANLKRKMTKMTRWRKTERKRVNQTGRGGTLQQPHTSKLPTAATKKDVGHDKKKKTKKAAGGTPLDMEGFIKPHYLTALDAMAKLQGHVEYAWGCDYCELRLRQLKTARFKTWQVQAITNGVKDLAENDQLEEMVRAEIEKQKQEDELTGRQQLSMDDIVKWREEPGYVVRYRPEKTKDDGKKRPMGERKVDATADSLVLSVEARGQDSDDDWEDLGWDESDGSGSVWVEVRSDDGKAQ